MLHCGMWLTRDWVCAYACVCSLLCWSMGREHRTHDWLSWPMKTKQHRGEKVHPELPSLLFCCVHSMCWFSILIEAADVWRISLRSVWRNKCYSLSRPRKHVLESSCRCHPFQVSFSVEIVVLALSMHHWRRERTGRQISMTLCMRSHQLCTAILKGWLPDFRRFRPAMGAELWLSMNKRVLDADRPLLILLRPIGHLVSCYVRVASAAPISRGERLSGWIMGRKQATKLDLNTQTRIL